MKCREAAGQAIHCRLQQLLLREMRVPSPEVDRGRLEANAGAHQLRGLTQRFAEVVARVVRRGEWTGRARQPLEALKCVDRIVRRLPKGVVLDGVELGEGAEHVERL